MSIEECRGVFQGKDNHLLVYGSVLIQKYRHQSLPFCAVPPFGSWPFLARHLELAVCIVVGLPRNVIVSQCMGGEGSH